MGTVSVSVSDELRKRMLQLDEVNWSAVARRAFEEKMNEVDILKRVAQKSKLTERDAKEISDEISRSMAKKFKSM